MRTIKVLLATAGTWGDLFPFIALGKELEARGHDVTLACSGGLRKWVVESGLKSLVFGGDFGKSAAQANAGCWDHWDSATGGVRRRPSRYAPLMDVLERNCRELAPHASEADLLILPSHCPEGRLVREMTGTPWISAILTPQEGLGDESGATRGEASDEPELLEAMSLLRRRLGLTRTISSYASQLRSDPSLFACSAALGRAASPEIRQTGFWFFEDPRWKEWRPDVRLARFMDECAGEDPPLVVSFSSLPLEAPARTLEIHLRAARLLGRRIVVQQGWSGFLPDQIPGDLDPERIFMADFIPHDWFLGRCGALITHGGIGTLGRALRNACPLVIEPYGNDQFYNAWIVQKRGYGTAVHPHRLTAEGLATVLAEKVLRPEARQGVKSASAVIRGEDGTGRACEWIEACCA